MTLIDRIMAPNRVTGELLDRLQPLAALAARWYVSWQFLKSGWLKLNSWDGTLYLFENEYHTPVLSPHVAAVAGTFGELFFPSLLVLGFMSRFAGLGLFAVNAMAVISYSDVLLADGWGGALIAPHILWGTLVVFLIVYGPGPLSLDRLLLKKPSTG
jgi:putative oxidoreductase